MLSLPSKITQRGVLAHLVERNTGSVEVSGSSPLYSTKNSKSTDRGLPRLVLSFIICRLRLLLLGWHLILSDPADVCQKRKKVVFRRPLFLCCLIASNIFYKPNIKPLFETFYCVSQRNKIYILILHIIIVVFNHYRWKHLFAFDIAKLQPKSSVCMPL